MLSLFQIQVAEKSCLVLKMMELFMVLETKVHLNYLILFQICTPQIEPAIVLSSIDNKTIIEIDIPAGKFRPYYLKNKRKESSTYIRINGTSRVADEIKLKELELEGKKISFDSMREIGKDYSEEKALALCKKMKQIALNAFTDDETNSVKELSIEKLVDNKNTKEILENLIKEYPNYPQMKLLDSCLWQYGYNLEKNKEANKK